MVKTLKIDDITHKRLRECGHMGETFDTVINKLIDMYLERLIEEKKKDREEIAKILEARHIPQPQHVQS